MSCGNQTTKIKVKGVKYERELANKFWKLGFAVLRGCSSGGGVKKRFVPDIVVIYRGNVVALEVKYRSKPSNIYIEKEKLVKLLEFSERCGGKAFIAIKFKGYDWKFLEITQNLINSCNSDKVPISKDDVLSKGYTLNQFVSMIKNLNLSNFLK